MRLSTWNTRLRQVALAGVVVLVAGCDAMSAQNPSGALKPVNAVAMQGSDRVMLQGADVVSYFTQGKPSMGVPQFKSSHQGVDFFFASAQNKALFDANPTAYLPQYGGYCANGIMFGIPWGGNASDYVMHNNKLYIFGGEQSKAAFTLNLDNNVALADQYWASEVQGNNSFVQRAKRLVLRVPHYQSGQEQADMLKAAGKNPS